MELCLRELFQFKRMQTDPNYSNFLLQPSKITEKSQIVLLDFGATKSLPDSFLLKYRELLIAAVDQDDEKCIYLSKDIGYLLGLESSAMIKAHLTSLKELAKPFRSTETDQTDFYDFSFPQVSSIVRSQIPIMLSQRLTPPPKETYTVHRKLSGAFLLCQKLGSRVRTRALFDRFARKL